ncbi:MAG: glucosaminidase domain-containing protein [Flavobacteriales bacterium]|nr:glucosaminidase domain-containing protein [Flavobacteriales bacterium]
MRKFFSISLLILFGFMGYCQKGKSQPAEHRFSRQEYIDTYKEDAIREMQRTGIPASITLAQGILESGDGNSPLAVYGKNHFGIKCHSDWKGKTMHLDDDAKNECFRKYKDVYESYRDHSDFLSTRGRYAFLFDLKITDYKGWAKGLKKAGYATHPKYDDMLIDLIEQNKLYQYDSYGKVPPRRMQKDRSSVSLAGTGSERTIKLHNNIKYIRVKAGDTYEQITQDYKMNLWQILKYNDLNKGDAIQEGDIIYLQPKKNTAKEEFHVVESGQSMRDISQLYGVKLKKLYKRNQMIMGTEPQVGSKIYLRKPKN